MSARLQPHQMPLSALDWESAWFSQPKSRSEAYDQIDESRRAIARLLGIPAPPPLPRSNRQPALYRLAQTALEHQAAIRVINRLHADVQRAASTDAPTSES